MIIANKNTINTIIPLYERNIKIQFIIGTIFILIMSSIIFILKLKSN